MSARRLGAASAGPRDEPDDRALLAAHVAGDPEAFGRLFSRHRDRLWAVALRTAGDPEEAADALQDGLVSAFRRADSYRGDAAVTTWLHRIVVNACLDRLRRRNVRLADPLPDDLDEYAGRPDTAARSALSLPGSTDPAAAALDHELRATVLAALETLPPEQKAALVLVDMEGYSVQEAADILECAPGTVKSRCARARARLAPILRGQTRGNHDPDRRVTSAERSGPAGTGAPRSPEGGEHQ